MNFKPVTGAGQLVELVVVEGISHRNAELGRELPN